MATAQMTNQTLPAGHQGVSRPNITAVGTIVWLASELMFFAGLFAMFFTLRGVDYSMWERNTPLLNVPFATVNTLILVVSSVWCQFGVFRAEEGRPSRVGGLFDLKGWGMREWYVLTYIFGAVFIALQAFEYTELVEHGVTLQSDGYGSVFYLTTGFHGLHVTAGLLAFLVIIGRTFTTRRYSHAQATGAIVTSYYWHFVDVIWVALYASIYLLK